MSRMKQIQNIDAVIHDIDRVTQSRCFFSEEDLKILQESKIRLQNLRKKKGKTNKEILHEVVDVVKLLSDFFRDGE